MENLNQEEWQKLKAKDTEAIIIDVRTPEEVEEGFIPGAINIDIYDAPNFMDRLHLLENDKNYFVYCKSGGRSAQACAIMDQMGFENTYNLLGGFSEWKGETEQ